MLTVWIVITLAAIVVEAFTVAVVSLWFAIGGVLAAAIYMLGGPVWLQVAVFISASIAILFLLRPLALKMLKDKEVKTNVDSIVGMKAVVTMNVGGMIETGEIKVDGKIWRAKCADENETFKVGEYVIVREVKGVTTIIEREKN